jgi:hypothetical protein
MVPMLSFQPASDLERSTPHSLKYSKPMLVSSLLLWDEEIKPARMP